MMTSVVSIMYHDVIAAGDDAASGFPGAGAATYKLERKQFEEHLQAIAERVPHQPIVTSDLASWTDASAPLLITFDDGGVSAHNPIADLLEARGWRGHFFVTTDYIDTPAFLNREQVRELHRRGHVMGSHSCSHPLRMSRCGWEDLVREWRASVEVLSDILGSRVEVASVPGGHYSRKVAEAASLAGIKTLFTSEPTTSVRRVDDCLVLGRYAIQRWTPTETAAALAANGLAPRLKQMLLWNAKKITKTLGGEYYLKVRRSLLAKTKSAAG